MADHVECDRCGTVGVRRRWTIAPEGWLYAVLMDEDMNEDESTYYVYACSEACARLDWQKGPGKLAERRLTVQEASNG